MGDPMSFKNHPNNSDILQKFVIPSFIDKLSLSIIRNWETCRGFVISAIHRNEIYPTSSNLDRTVRLVHWASKPNGRRKKTTRFGLRTIPEGQTEIMLLFVFVKED